MNKSLCQLRDKYLQKGLNISYSKHWHCYIVTPENNDHIKNIKIGECSFEYLKVFGKENAYNLDYVLGRVGQDHPSWLTVQ
jgi:hypothetical protein